MCTERICRHRLSIDQRQIIDSQKYGASKASDTWLTGGRRDAGARKHLAGRPSPTAHPSPCSDCRHRRPSAAPVAVSTCLPTRPSARLPTNISNCVHCDNYWSRHRALPLKSHLDSCVKDNVHQRANRTSSDSGLWVAPLMQEIEGVKLHEKSSLLLLDSCI